MAKGESSYAGNWKGFYGGPDGTIAKAERELAPLAAEGNVGATVSLASVYYSAGGNARSHNNLLRAARLFLRAASIVKGLNPDTLNEDQCDVVSTILSRAPWRRQKARKIAQFGITLCQEKGVGYQKSGTAKPHTYALLMMTMAHLLFRRDPSKAGKYASRSLDIAAEVAEHDPRQASRIYKQVGVFYRRSGAKDTDNSYFDKAARLAKEAGATDQVEKINAARR